MMRFNYLRDSAPESFEYLRPSRIPEPLRTPLAALVTAMLVVGVWWVIEQLLLSQARAELQAQTLRLAASKAALAELKLRKIQVRDLLAIDSRLREVPAIRCDAIERSRGYRQPRPGSCMAHEHRAHQ